MARHKLHDRSVPKIVFPVKIFLDTVRQARLYYDKTDRSVLVYCAISDCISS